MNQDALDGTSLAINNVSIRATVLGDDTVSTTLRSSSAIAKAEAINDSTEFTGVTAYVTESVRAGTGDVDGGNLDESNYIMINDRIFTGFTVEAGDANEAFINAVNADLGETGVIASRDQNGQIKLTAADGRNIDVQAVGNAAAVTGLQTSVTTASVRLVSDNQFQLTGTAEAAVGFGDDALVAVTAANSVHSINVETRQGANDALLILDRAISQVARDRSELGAVQNRMQSTINNLASVSENAAAAKSRILDADFAAESANLARNQILTQAATTIWLRRTKFHSKRCPSYNKSRDNSLNPIGGLPDEHAR